MKALGWYVIAISVISVLAVIYDKSAAVNGRRRIPEKHLLLLGFVGGAASMLAAMLLIRHKTRKKKFMLVLPVFCLLHFSALIFLKIN